MSDPETIKELEQSVFEFIQKYGTVTFIELEREFPIFANGDQDLMDQEHNIIFWIDLTPVAINVLANLINSGKIYVHLAHWLSYVSDGCILKYEVTERKPKKAYKETRWIPLFFDVKKYEHTKTLIKNFRIGG